MKVHLKKSMYYKQNDTLKNNFWPKLTRHELS